MSTPIPEPTEAQVREAFEQHTMVAPRGRWAFRSHPMNEYTEAECLTLTRVNLMLGTNPNGSLSARMLELIVDRIVAIEKRLDAQEEEARERRG